MSRFSENDRVTLLASEESATVIAVEGRRMYLVSLDRQYRTGLADDGIREVAEDQLREYTAPERKHTIRRKR